MKPQDRKRVTADLKSWLDCVAAYDKKFQKWENRAKVIIQKYVDEQTNVTSGNGASRYNILWANVQTLKAATFSKLPKADVSRRFKDQDPVGRVAGLLLERAIDYEISHYPDYRATMDSSVLDRFLGGRGTSWVRYEPHMRAAQLGEPEDGEEITEDVDEPGEELDYECAPTDYVHYRDFGHSVARTWEEVTRVWRKVYLRRAELVERFGEEIGNAIPLDATPDELKKKDVTVATDTACVYEGWDKEKKQAVWFVKSFKDFLDVRDDPLGLEQFWPCPRPLYATLSNDSLEPTPDYALYQDQANDLNVLSDRIDGLIKALKVTGCYDASLPALARLFTEGENTSLIPVKSWTAFAEKNGLKGAIDIVDLTPIANALNQSYQAMAQVKQQIYDITGISDIIRGQTNASETATAQQLKGQYASLRLKTYQDQVALYATALIQLKAQIICNKFDPDTIYKIAGADQLNESDKQYIQPAMQLLLGDRLIDPESTAPNPMRDFRVEVNADSLVYLDEQSEKESRTEFLNATSGFMQSVMGAMAQVPPQVAAVLTPVAMEMLKFGVTGFRVGKTIEGVFDAAADHLAQIAKQPPPPQPDPEAAKLQAKQATDQQQMQQDAQLEQMRLQMEERARQAELQTQMQFEAFKEQITAQREERQAEREAMMAQQVALQEQQFERFKALLEAKTKVEVAEISANATMSVAQKAAAEPE